MAEASNSRNYPPRQYKGKSPIQHKSINHNFRLSNLKTIEEAVGIEVWESIKISAVGVIARLKDVHYIWYAKLVNSFLCNQLSIESSHEIWSLIDGIPLRFSLYEYEEITSLNCDSFDRTNIVQVDHNEFWLEMNVSPAHGPSLNELLAICPHCRDWSFEKKRMLGWLSILSIGIYGISPSSRLPLEEAKRVLNPDAFQRHPWGRVGFSCLMESIKTPVLDGEKTYVLHGCVHVLLIWVYESVVCIGAESGRRIEGANVPLLAWLGGRPRKPIEVICDKEKKDHGKVRVRRMVMKDEESRYPQWEEDVVQEELDNLLFDIIHGRLNESFWISSTESKSLKRKTTQSSTKDYVHCTSIKRKRTREEDYIDKEEYVRLSEAIQALASSVNSIDTRVAEMVGSRVEDILKKEVELRISSRDDDLLKRIACLEQEVKDLKKRNMQKTPTKPVNIVADDECDASSKTLSWELQDRINEEGGSPVPCVVRKQKNLEKKVEKKTKIRKDNEKKVIKVKKEKMPVVKNDDEEKVLKAPDNIPHVIPDESEDEWDKQDRERITKIKDVLDDFLSILSSTLKDNEDAEHLPKRKQKPSTLR